MAIKSGGLLTLGFDHDAVRHPYPDAVGSAPTENGIYIIVDGEDRCIYVGKADSETTTIRSRLQAHVRGDDPANTRCINSHLPVAFAALTTDELPTRGTLSEFETMFIQDYKREGQAWCNER